MHNSCLVLRSILLKLFRGYLPPGKRHGKISQVPCEDLIFAKSFFRLIKHRGYFCYQPGFNGREQILTLLTKRLVSTEESWSDSMLCHLGGMVDACELCAVCQPFILIL